MNDSVAHYNLLERIGEGGIGEVYRARDTRVGRTVALKLTGPLDAEGTGQLLAAAQQIAGLSHPGIATLFDAGAVDGRVYLAYEFVQGPSLRQLIAGSPLHVRRALDLGIQIADALADAHAQGVLHKDLRPETIVETAKGRAKILDLGLARWTRGGRTRARAAASPDSVPADDAGILAYVSPEQALGDRVDARSDIFSAAVIVYEMLTGRNPFSGRDPAGTLVNVTRVEPEPPSGTNAEVPPQLDGAVLRALAKDLSRRTASADALSADLKSCRASLDRSVEPAGATGAPAARARGEELLPLVEERPAAGLWLFVAALAAALGAALYYWIR